MSNTARKARKRLLNAARLPGNGVVRAFIIDKNRFKHPVKEGTPYVEREAVKPKRITNGKGKFIRYGYTKNQAAALRARGIEVEVTTKGNK